MKRKNILFWKLGVLVSSLLLFSSCDDYLDKQPSKGAGIPITTYEQLSGILSRYSSFNTDANKQLILASDSYEVSPELYLARPSNFSDDGMSQSLWEVEYLTDSYSAKGSWGGDFGIIYNANLVLTNVDHVSGTLEQKEEMKAEAYLIRAYSYFNLVNTFCLPYTEKNKNEMGLPIKKSTSFEEDLTRVSLEATYQFIEDDIQEALKLKMSATAKRNWRGNVAAANGLAARFYLLKGDYTKAMIHANTALADYSELVDYNTEMSFEEEEVMINGSTDDYEYVTINYPHTWDISTGADALLVANYKGNYYYRNVYHSNDGWFVPSAKLLSLYNQTYDLRYKYHIVENLSYDWGMDDPAYSYPGYVQWSYQISSGPCSAEMLLIKAECLARLGDYTEAMNVVNQLRVTRFSTETPVNVLSLTASTKQEAISLILDERQREMPFTQRWLDIRRCNSNNDPNDDITLVKTFFPVNEFGVLKNDPIKEYRLAPDSRRYALPIPADDITASRGVIKQNTY
ncbi:RagB/SusD family nutrient uptake outer membrane protein [Labilibaculum sp. A4]|uniref:RagB/SusD family nutrient uptake outer membrane protein n=1 Tax=Labilibaculum euxinus TaxID=2686357 RepID=UPI000F61A7D9|nr:RagB/SusD family nutrient uptake outer membrane protein [Labilibaculum euxinus]MDQ1770641.1 RagB/SusD family nutrient uptake outer membrane protein [Labilibaculum euxinus]MWN75139.1 RagB/SusD family nutrient uptake outer membrane protein [Labilibaculum euxinus]